MIFKETMTSAMGRILKQEIRNWEDLATGQYKNLPRPMKVEGFVLDEEAGVGAFVLTGTIDVYRGPRETEEQCSVWVVRASGETYRAHHAFAHVTYEVESFAGEVYYHPWDETYKVERLRIEGREIVANRYTGERLAISFEEALSGGPLVERP